MVQAHGITSRVSAFLTILCLMTQVIGCRASGEEEILGREFSKFVAELESDVANGGIVGADLRLERAHAVSERASTSASLARTLPALDGVLTQDPVQAKEFVLKNQTKIVAWLDEMDATTKVSRQLIFEISKESYELGPNPMKDRDSMILYFALTYQKYLYRTLVQGLAPLLMALGSEDLKTVPEIATFQEVLAKRFFTYFGSEFVIQRDLSKVVGELKASREKGTLIKPFDEILSTTHTQIVKTFGPSNVSIENTLSQLSPEAKVQFQDAIKNIQTQFNQVSFLYSPEMNLSVFGNIMTAIGNLTWGLFNTLIGVGIVLAAIIISPFSPYVDFPTFRIAANGRQIYVDVTGIVPGVRGKMSMGLFELDNGTGYDFASGHEGAHSIQSAMLGPFYLPVILATYIACGFDQGPMEEWADDWAHV